MKKIIICLVAVLLFAGCDSLIEPNHIKDPEMLGWVYRDCIGYSIAEKIRGNFIGDVRKHTLKVEGFESIGALEDEVINYFKNAPLPIHYEGDYWDSYHNGHPAYSLKEYLKQYGDVLNYEPKAIVVPNMPKAQSLLTELIKEFFSYFERVAQGQFKVLSWDYDKGAQGDSYTGYLIEYEIGEGYYVLLSLIEYDKTNRYKADIIYKGSSLQELNNCYE